MQLDIEELTECTRRVDLLVRCAFASSRVWHRLCASKWLPPAPALRYSCRLLESAVTDEGDAHVEGYEHCVRTGCNRTDLSAIKPRRAGEPGLATDRPQGRSPL